MSDQSMLWGMSLHFWDIWGVRALIAGGVLGAVTVVVASASAYVLYRVADQAQAELKTESSEHALDLAKLVKETALANEGAAKAAEQAATANARAASLEKDAALARLETQRIKESIAWREVSPHQVARLVNSLQGQRFDIPLSYTANDPEASTYADQLADALVAAGISVTLNPTAWVGIAPVGVRVSQTEGIQAERLKAALTHAGIPFTFSAATPELRMSVGGKERAK